ncbi:protein FAR1-RELATED SEQUENCE 5-like [Vicia villosa]|uniref:protein FAR1-RELATED SEQUENCE 5-like n=1 Tax=Vicia villosa TaxID=3911 RepID=UPI00273CDA65|nr:protein FAR1-RELATED SEQUENCE 5-like [Vicia villosa]
MAHPDNISGDELEVPEDVNVDAKFKESIKDVKTIVIAVDWVRNKASKFGFSVVIARSDNSTSRRQAFVMMRCERGGKYVPTNRKLKHDDTRSRKCACSFKLRTSCRVDGLWCFSVICEIHNHTLETKLHDHPESELSIIKVAPRNILADLKRKRPDSVSNIKQVYNEHYNLSTTKKGPRSKIQHLLKLLGDNQYVSSFKACEDIVTVRDIFWTHCESINLFNTFATILIIDSTYKTNKYRLILLEIIGVTSTDKTLSVGFAFLQCEKEDNFIWALGIC